MSDGEIRRRIKRSQAQETRGAKRLGGRRQSGSGSGWSRKGDVRTREELVEYKRTDAKSIRLDAVALRKAEEEALVEGRRAVLGFELQRRHYVVLTEDEYEELRSASTCQACAGSLMEDTGEV